MSEAGSALQEAVLVRTDKNLGAKKLTRSSLTTFSIISKRNGGKFAWVMKSEDRFKRSRER